MNIISPINLIVDASQQNSTTELSQYSCWNWHCIRKVQDTAGFRLLFQLCIPPDGTKISPFPAEIPRDTRWNNWMPIESKYNLIPQIEKELEPSFNATMNQLGFEVDQENKTITIPDAASFKHRWSANNRPKLRIISTEGILNDFEYIKVWMENDLIFSEGAESLHDFCDHSLGILRIIHMKSWNYYISTKEEYTRRLLPKLEKLEALRKGTNLEKFDHDNEEWKFLQSNLSTLDMLVSSIADSLFEKNTESYFDQCAFANYGWENYFCERTNSNIDALRNLWLIFNAGIEAEEDVRNKKLLSIKFEIIHSQSQSPDFRSNFWRILLFGIERRRIILEFINKVLSTKEYTNDPAQVANHLYDCLRHLIWRDDDTLFESIKHNCRIYSDTAKGLNKIFSLLISTSKPLFVESISEL